MKTLLRAILASIFFLSFAFAGQYPQQTTQVYNATGCSYNPYTKQFQKSLRGPTTVYTYKYNQNVAMGPYANSGITVPVGGSVNLTGQIITSLDNVAYASRSEVWPFGGFTKVYMVRTSETSSGLYAALITPPSICFAG